jgi:hypothetical protein
MVQILGQTIDPTNVGQTLFVLRDADMTLTTDQGFTKKGAFINYVVTNVVTVLKSGAFSVACIGGIYTGSNKSGDAILIATQSYATLTGVGTITIAPLSNLTADIFIVGTIVD